jgi:phosphatidylserine/phosphatidylglycerophosphate/cardiolipin synthase-like enzyme
MKIELLVDAAQFWERMREDLARARRSSYVQTFSFEGDRVGTRLAKALHRSRAPDRRLLVDGYSRLYHSDRLIAGPAWLERTFRREVMLTRRWVDRLRAGDARVRFGKPLGGHVHRGHQLQRPQLRVARHDAQDRIPEGGGSPFRGVPGDVRWARSLL